MYSDTWIVELLNAQGFHPSLHITPPASLPKPPDPQCLLALSFSLPPSIFPDPYQLYGLVPHLGDMVLSEEPDLEKPLSQVPAQDLSLVLLHPPTSSPWTLPLHARYQSPSTQGPRSQPISLSPPRALWRCKEPLAWRSSLSKEGRDRAAWSSPAPGGIISSPQDTSPNDPLSIWVYEADDIKILSPSPLSLSIPIGNLDDAPWVAWITSIVCTLGAIYILLLTLFPKHPLSSSSSSSKKLSKLH
ncbi:MAG: PIG-X [Piptocephalis tieghemiana]|nr:MAG: PIG-X [Piptocephalis tieghemiana]